jgi:hypothetical protein
MSAEAAARGSTTADREPERERGAFETHRVSWGASCWVTSRALFRLYADRAVLQHIRWVRLRQKGESRSGLDPAPALADVPDRELETLRDRGYTLTEGTK